MKNLRVQLSRKEKRNTREEWKRRRNILHPSPRRTPIHSRWSCEANRKVTRRNGAKPRQKAARCFVYRRSRYRLHSPLEIYSDLESIGERHSSRLTVLSLLYSREKTSRKRRERRQRSEGGKKSVKASDPAPAIVRECIIVLLHPVVPLHLPQRANIAGRWNVPWRDKEGTRHEHGRV